MADVFAIPGLAEQLDELDAATARRAGELLAATRSSATFDAVLVASAATRRARCWLTIQTTCGHGASAGARGLVL